jgi:hypothetical protein
MGLFPVAAMGKQERRNSGYRPWEMTGKIWAPLLGLAAKGDEKAVRGFGFHGEEGGATTGHPGIGSRAPWGSSAHPAAREVGKWRPGGWSSQPLESRGPLRLRGFLRTSREGGRCHGCHRGRRPRELQGVAPMGAWLLELHRSHGEVSARRGERFPAAGRRGEEGKLPARCCVG